jgi:predicted negative regulator of RcsB-dependent stress response
VRYTRHELKQDKFAESAAEALHEVAEHRAGIIKTTVVLVVAGLLIGGAYWYVTSRQQAASDALGQALVMYNAPVVPPSEAAQSSMLTYPSNQERLIAAKNAFYAISGKYGWTGSGQYARYLAAMCERQLGNDAVAQDQLRALSDSRHRELAALATYALASVYRDEKHYQDAITLLQTLIDKPTVSVPKVTAQLALAGVYNSEQQPAKAKVILNEIVKQNPNNELSEIAKSRESTLQ